jgi:hypothetical protein
MIYQGGTWKTPPATEWGVRAIPASYLVNPQGVVVATNLRGEDLRPLLDFFLSRPGDYPPVAVSARPTERKSAAEALPVHFELYNPVHTPLKLEVTVSQYVPVYAADDPDHKNRPIDMQEKRANPSGPDYTYDVDCSNFGTATEDMQVPIDPGATSIEIDYRVQLPNSIDSAHPDGVWTSGYYYGGLKIADAEKK